MASRPSAATPGAYAAFALAPMLLLLLYSQPAAAQPASAARPPPAAAGTVVTAVNTSSQLQAPELNSTVAASVASTQHQSLLARQSLPQPVRPAAPLPLPSPRDPSQLVKAAALLPAAASIPPTMPTKLQARPPPQRPPSPPPPKAPAPRPPPPSPAPPPPRPSPLLQPPPRLSVQFPPRLPILPPPLPRFPSPPPPSTSYSEASTSSAAAATPPPAMADAGLKQHQPLPPSQPAAPEAAATAGNFQMVGLGMVVAVHLVHVPNTTEYLFMERPSGRHPDRSTIIAGLFDSANYAWTPVDALDSLFCGGHCAGTNGEVFVVGGHTAKTGYLDGMRSIRTFQQGDLALKNVQTMLFPRWYPTATTLSDGQVLIMGGTVAPGSGTKNNPTYEVWDPNTNELSEVALHPSYVRVARDIYYPFNYVLPSGDLFTFCDYVGMVMHAYDGTVISWLPPLPRSASRLRTQYPYTGTSVLLPLTSINNYTAEVMTFGGQFTSATFTSPAADLSLRLSIRQDDGSEAYKFGGWEVERMPYGRVMPDAVLLPNGRVIILNGAKQGMAGDAATGGGGKANEPALHAFEYQPSAPANQRYRQLAASTIPRMYHSTAALTLDGAIIVAGCDRCSQYTVTPSITPEPISRSPTGHPEYRVEIFYPPYYHSPDRPSIVHAPADMQYRRTYQLRYSQPSPNLRITSAMLIAPSSATHSSNMHQRAVALDIVADDGAGLLTVRGPPSVFVAVPGFYMLFVCNEEVYSPGVWVKLPLGGPATSVWRRT